MPGAALASPPPSPYPGRRAPLSTKTENELRIACAGVCINTKPSHHYVPEDHCSSSAPKPALDYDAIKRSASTRSRPSLPRADSAETTHPAKYTYRPDSSIDQLFVKPDPTNDTLSRRKHDTPMSSHSKTPVPANVVSPSDQVKERPRANQRSFSAETSNSTPHTDVTEYPWSTSTAATSAAITPARASKRASSHMPADQEQIPKADATAIEWMRNELERRRRRQVATEPAPAPTPAPQSRAPSRTRSIRNNIKEYIRPSTAGSVSREPSRPSSRSASRASHRTTEIRDHSRDPSIRGGWRSWGRSRKDDGNNMSRSSSLRGRSEGRKGSTSTKSELNLNRELPPLPSLDRWKQTELQQAPESSHRPSNSVHSRAGISVGSETSEKDEIVAARLGSPVKERPEVYIPTRSPENISSTGVNTFGHAFTHDNLASFGNTRLDSVAPRSKSTNRIQTHEPTSSVRVVEASHGRKDGTNYSHVHSPTGPAQGFPNVATGFSKHRNYDSSNIPPALASSKPESKAEKASYKQKEETKYRHVMDILRSRSPPPVPPKDDKKAWWNLKAKSKKPSTWMDQLEKLGIKDGLLVNDDACGAPHIRY